MLPADRLKILLIVQVTVKEANLRNTYVSTFVISMLVLAVSRKGNKHGLTTAGRCWK